MAKRFNPADHTNPVMGLGWVFLPAGATFVIAFAFVNLMFDSIAQRRVFDQQGADVVSFYYLHVSSQRGFVVALSMIYGLTVLGAALKAAVVRSVVNTLAFVAAAFPLVRIPAIVGYIAALGESQYTPMALDEQHAVASALFWEHAVTVAVLFAFVCLQVLSLAQDGIARLDFNTRPYDHHIRSMEAFIRQNIPRPPSSQQSHPKAE